MTRSVFQATFYDQKPLKTHGSHLFVFEVPNELADEALRILGGLPRHAKEHAVWVGIARIDPDKANPAKAVNEAPKPADEPKIARPFNELPLSQQAALRCQDRDFRAFLRAIYPEHAPINNAEQAAYVVRSLCGVSSRADILSGTQAGGRWLLLMSAYESFP